jgi:hypothetical protein
MKRRAAMSEATLQEHVVKLLQAYGRSDICWFHVPNGESRSKKTGARLKRMGVRAGVADLIFLVDGRMIALELKTEIGHIRKEQEEFAEGVMCAGGEYRIAYGLSGALTALHAINVIRPNITLTPTAVGCAGGARGASAPPSLSSDPKARRRPRFSAQTQAATGD